MLLDESEREQTGQDLVNAFRLFFDESLYMLICNMGLRSTRVVIRPVFKSLQSSAPVSQPNFVSTPFVKQFPSRLDKPCPRKEQLVALMRERLARMSLLSSPVSRA